MLQRILGALVIATLLIAGGVYAYRTLLTAPDEAEQVIYATTEVERGDLHITVQGSGNLNPRYSEQVRSHTEGILEEVLIDQGDTVEEGEVVARMSSDALLEEVDQMERQLERAITELGMTLGVEPEEALAMDPNQGIHITAPIDGRVQNIQAEEDHHVDRASVVAEIIEDSSVLVEGEFTPRQFDEIEEGMQVEMYPKDFSGTVEGEIVDANPVPVPRANRYVHEVTVKAENPGLLQPGSKMDIALSGSGTVAAEVSGYADETLVWSSAEGTVVDVPVREWQSVDEGDTLLILGGSDTRDFIYEEQLRIEDKQREVEEKRLLKEQLDIRSPINGMVGHVMMPVEGQEISDGQTIAAIIDTTMMSATIEVDEVDIVHLDQGMEAEVTVDAFPGDVFPAELTGLDMMGRDEEGITVYRVQIDVRQTERVRPGMTGDISIFVDEAEDVLLIPIESVYAEQDQAMVEVLTEGNQVEAREIEVGLIGARYAEVESGLEKGETIVTGSTEDLLEGDELDEETPSIIPQGGG